MSWNECLFWYARERGGTFFGLDRKEEEEGVLILEDPKGSILISTKVTGSNRYTVSRDVTAALQVELERPYTLRVKAQSILREGFNNVLEGLDRGARMMGKKTGLYQDYGAPEIVDDRGVKTSERDFTRWVLQSRELRELLKEQPDLWFQVGPVGPQGQTHLVEARVSLERMAIVGREWGDSGSLEELKASYEASGFSRQLDTLVALAKTARDAVTAWPMPMEGAKL